MPNGNLLDAAYLKAKFPRAQANIRLLAVQKIIDIESVE